PDLRRRVNDVPLDAHRKAVEAIRSGPGGAPVGLVLAMSDCQAVAGGEAERDRYRRDMEDVFLEATHGDDFFGVQCYSRTRFGPAGMLGPEEGVRLTQMGYEFWPEALEATIRRAWEVTRGVPILVTENGIGTEDDAERIEFVGRALTGVLACLADGIDVRGYVYWSLLDELRDQPAVVTGGSRGFGRGIVEALAGAGMRVVALARDPGALAALAREVKGRVETVAGDATDPVTAARVIDRERPRVLVLNAGATGPHRPTRLQTWETFSVFWQTDVRSAFLWVREALALPLERGSTIFIGSSTAAWSSQPLIAGYATAKAALWEFARCVAPEAASLGLRVHCLLPVLTRETAMG